MSGDLPKRNEGSAGGAGIPRRRFLLNGFLGGTLAALAAAVVYPVLRFLSPPQIAEAVTNQVLAAKVSELAETKWKVFPFGSDPGLVVEIAPGEYRAYAAMCTHLSCTVQYDEPSKRIWCACHNGWYDMTGRNISGPPPKPLERYEVNVVGEDIFVTRG